MWIWIVVGIAVVLVIALVGSYNRFVKQRNLIKDAWANIDTELRRRYDLIPNLVETVRGYARHEQATFENVTKARTMATQATGSPAAQAAAEGPLVAALRQLMLVAEAYPDLKANQNFLQLQGELGNTEDRLQTARRFYNANVREFNTRVQSFPSMIVARLFGFKEEEYFEVEESLRGDEGVPQVDFATPPAGSAAPAAQAAPPSTSASPPPSAPAPGQGAAADPDGDGDTDVPPAPGS